MMATGLLAAVGLVGLIAFRKATPKKRILILLILLVAMPLLACDENSDSDYAGANPPTDNGGEDWNLDESKDVTGAVWRMMHDKGGNTD